MDRTLNKLGRRELLVVSLLLVVAARGEASQESLLVYEDWTTSPTMGSERWVAVDTTTLEVRREVKGHRM